MGSLICTNCCTSVSTNTLQISSNKNHLNSFEIKNRIFTVEDVALQIQKIKKTQIGWSQQIQLDDGTMVRIGRLPFFPDHVTVCIDTEIKTCNRKDVLDAFGVANERAHWDPLFSNLQTDFNRILPTSEFDVWRADTNTAEFRIFNKREAILKTWSIDHPDMSVHYMSSIEKSNLSKPFSPMKDRDSQPECSDSQELQFNVPFSAAQIIHNDDQFDAQVTYVFVTSFDTKYGTQSIYLKPWTQVLSKLAPKIAKSFKEYFNYIYSRNDKNE